jgi:gliding motility-associated-like protein
MRILNSLILFLILLPFAVIAQVNLQQGLLAYYPFTGNANDSSGNGKHGTVSNASLAADRCGKANSAYSFNGTNAYIEIPTSTLQTQYYSYSMWINADVIPGSGLYTYPFAIGVSGSGQNIALTNNSMNGWSAGASNSGSPSLSLLAKGCQPTTNKWYHVVLIRDTNKIKLYINGSLNVHDPGYSGSSATTGGNSPTYGTSPRAFFGSRDLTSGYYFKGLVDDVRIYNRVINAFEIDSLYREKPCFFNGQNPYHVAQYNFSGNANDSRGGNHGTVNGASLTTDRFGISNSAYQFTASSSNYISIPPCPFLLNNYSYSVWVKLSTSPASGSAYIYLSIGSNADQNMQVENNQNNGAMGYLTGFTLTAYMKNGSTVSTGGVASGTLPSNSVWYHVVCTRDNNYFKVYVNGCLVSTSTSYSGALPYYGTSTMAARIGARQSGSKYFNGALDDVGIYSKVLSANEIARLYHDNKPFSVTRDTTICQDVFKPFKLKSDRGYCSYKWIDVTNRSTVLGTDSQLLISINKTTTFRVFNHTGDSATVKVTINPKPVVKLGNDTAYCGNFSRTLDAQNIGTKYVWNTSDTSQTLLVNAKGWYGVKSTNTNGCIGRDSIYIDHHPLPVLNLGNDTLICGSFTHTLDAKNPGAKYIWQGGDTTSQITINKKGVFSVKVVDSFSCMNFDTIEIKNPRIKALYALSDTMLCFHTNKFNLKDTSKYIDDSWKSSIFYFGDGNKKTDTLTQKIYTDTGTYKVKLVLQSMENCKDSIIKTVTILPSTNIGFTINKAAQCDLGHGFNFTNLSTISQGNLIYDWQFGDNSNSVLTDIIGKTYLKDSTYMVRLIATSDKNCKDTMDKFVTVHPNTKVGFIPSKVTQCFNYHHVDFNNTSFVRTGSIATYGWSLGDNTSSSNRDITGKKYSTADSFKIHLLTITDKGCRDSVEKTIHIWPNTVIGFNVNKDTQCYEWNRFDFTNTSTLQAGTMSYDWQHGDGGVDTTKDIAAKKYASFGSYDVRLVTTTEKNCKDTIQKTVIIHASPIAKFSIDKDRQCFRDNVFNFTNQTSINNGVISLYDWDLDNGQQKSSLHIPNYSFTTEDSFDVRLIVLSDQGCYDTVNHLAVTFAQPVAKYQIPNDSQCWQKHYFIIDNKTTLKYGQLNSIWDFGDGTKDSNYTPLTKKYANKSAKYTVRYKVSSDHGCTDSLNHNINLLERPISEFDINDSVQCFRGHLFSFVNKTTFSAMNTLTYYWDYGNGNTSTGITPQTSTYANAQYHPVTLVSHSYLTNCYDTVIYNVLPAPHSVPDFTVDNDSQCLRFNQFNFTNLSTISFGNLAHKWDYKDGTGSNLKDPSKHYDLDGNYRVKLVVTTNHDCKDSIEKPVILIPHPKAGFLINDTSQCLNKHGFDLANATTVAYGTYGSNWIFDDATTDAGKDVTSKRFSKEYYHKIILTVNSNYGCTDTTERWVYLEKPKSTKILLTDKDSQCLKGNKYGFSVQSIDPAVTYANYLWAFGDGNSGASSVVNHKYNKDGSIKVMLETTSANGCKDTGYYDLVVHPQPLSSFTANDPCFPDSAIFTNTSAISSGNITSYKWDFGDGSGSTLLNPVKYYANPGYYQIRLISESSYGCIDTLVKNNGAWVRPKPDAYFTFKRLPDKQFDVATLEFKNLSSADVVKNDWNFGNGNTSNEVHPITDFNDSNRKTITLIVTNSENCTDTFSVPSGSLISDFVFYLPNAFSPNANEHNDVYKPVATPYVHSYIMEIFNMWGEKVFESKDITKGWDGTYQGVICPQGVYVCRVYLVPLRGSLQHHELTLTLLR